MIRVIRPKEPPKAIKAEKSRGAAELAAWKAYYALQEEERKKAKKPTAFKAYYDESVVKALREIFHDKCAYCETPLPAGDVEHYRPKGAVKRAEKDKTKYDDGYWWLAVKWDNLLFSCVSCNQRRKKPGAEGNLATSGKGIYFPVVEELGLWEGVEKQEVPLLLNPTTDTPEKYMHVNTGTGEDAGCMQAVVKEDGALDQRGQTTIELLGLNNAVIVRQRRWLLGELRERFGRIVDLAAQLDTVNSPAERKEVLRLLREELERFAAYRAAEKPFLMLSRQMTSQLMDRFKTNSA